ncbi:hypothetical protein FA15DRAFT_699779 [Coprinopsis marcescibilis]|uniref:Uncharacterized protein n=1 Tax=Coprinopsis marcescibilis TaxID=230819 RepID=A0A5C3LB02_COPMA|nr:hypothetical protein FA15DRAFT_699779 [Coprinopsis marcescibilis]
MAGQPPRSVYYDDSDLASGISYSDEWFQRNDSFSNDAGLVHRGTHHGTFAGQASMTFSFIGTSIFVAGRVETTMIRGEARSSNWTCRIDGERVPNAMDNISDTAVSLNNFRLCSRSGLSETRHLLSIEVQASQAFPFWVDRFSVRPPPNQLPQNVTVQVDPLDEDLRYATGRWESPEGSQYRFTTEPGASVLLDFHGTKLTWISDTLSGQPTGLSQGIYTLDDNDPVVFNITGLAPGGRNLGNRVLFETQSFTHGKHRLNVTYLGFSAPLVLDRLMVESGDILALGGTSLESPFAPRGRSSGTSNVGGIIGGVVGGVVAMLLLLAGWILYRKRRAKAEELAPVLDVEAPFPTTMGYGFGSEKPATYQESHASHYGAVYAKEAPNPTSSPPPVHGSASPPRVNGQDDAVATKARLAQRYAALDAVAVGSSSQHQPDSYGAPDRVEVLHHDDSGIRLGSGGQGSGVMVEELPPSYTIA